MGVRVAAVYFCKFCEDLTIESINLRGISTLCNFGKPYKRGLIETTGLTDYSFLVKVDCYQLNLLIFDEFSFLYPFFFTRIGKILKQFVGSSFKVFF